MTIGEHIKNFFGIVGLIVMSVLSIVYHWGRLRQGQSTLGRVFSGTPRIPEHPLGGVPRCTIGNPQMEGPSKIEGRIIAMGPLLISPLTRQKCVYYEVRAQRFNGKNWTDVGQVHEVTAFYIDDGTGRARMETSTLRVEGDYDKRFDSLTSEQLAAMHRQGLRKEGERWYEMVLRPNETIAVCGLLNWEHDPTAATRETGYRDVPKTLLVGPLKEGFVVVPPRPLFPVGYGNDNATSEV